jgi:polar amino acid transport system substrate-binding protein
MTLQLPVVLALLLASSFAGATNMRICVDEQSHMPFINPAGEGVVGMLIRQAAEEAGMTVTFYAAPTTRCREELRAGVADGFPTTPYTTALLPFVAFPMVKSNPDPSRAAVTGRALVFRRKESSVGWDGKRFTNLQRPAMLPFGAVLLSDRLRAMQVPFDDKGKSLQVVFAKLLAGRGDVAIGAEYSGRAAMTDPRYAGKIDALPVPFSEEPYYLGVSRQFYAANGPGVEQLWSAMGHLRASPAYRANYQKEMLAAERAKKE